MFWYFFVAHAVLPYRSSLPPLTARAGRLGLAAPGAALGKLVHVLPCVPQKSRGDDDARLPGSASGCPAPPPPPPASLRATMITPCALLVVVTESWERENEVFGEGGREEIRDARLFDSWIPNRFIPTVNVFETKRYQITFWTGVLAKQYQFGIKPHHLATLEGIKGCKTSR